MSDFLTCDPCNIEGRGWEPVSHTIHLPDRLLEKLENDMETGEPPLTVGYMGNKFKKMGDRLATEKRQS